MDLGWVVFGLCAAGISGAAFYLRTLRRWRSPAPTSVEDKQAEARL